ncbi:MAG: hypothetical protein AAF170_18335 [Bacteroidota bacterium]
MIVVAILLGSCSPSSGMLRAQTVGADSLRESPAFTAVVSESTAAFVLPVSNRAEWVWSAEETPNNAPEYHWEIGVTNEGEAYQFGFWKFKHPSLEPTRGSLSDLIEAGQESLWQEKAGGGSSVVMSAGVRVTPIGQGRILVSIEGRENVARVFSSRPKEAMVVLASLGEQKIEQTIEIVYKDSVE